MKERRAHGAVRALQAVLLVGAALLALRAAEPAAPTSETLAVERAALSFEAPVVLEKGPWGPGDTLTEDDVGVPLDAAPVWTVHARHDVQGGSARAETWEARVRIEKVSGDGRAWWTVVEPVDLLAEGPTAAFTLHARDLVERARALDEEAGAPGRLDVVLEVTCRSLVTIAGEERISSRTARLFLAPADDLALVTASADAQEYARATEPGFDATPLVLVGAAVALEGLAWRIRRAMPAWARARGVRAVEVKALEAPPGASECALDDLLDAAREGGHTVVVSRASGLAVLQGEAPLFARLARDEPVPFRELENDG